jgi:hypothetical protein
MREEYNARARQAGMQVKDISKAGNSRQWACERRHFAVGQWRGRRVGVLGLVYVRESAGMGCSLAPGRDLGVLMDDSCTKVRGRAGVTGVLVRHGGGDQWSTGGS